MDESEFIPGAPLGYFITWTAYGTWLPGDARGWQKKGDTERQRPNLLFVEMAESAMKETSFSLAPIHRQIVESTVRRHCHIRDWHLHAINARSNHVHVVVTAPRYDPETVRDQFKAWCTRKLKEIEADRENFWAEGGSRRYLNTEEDLENAIRYVNEAQDHAEPF